MLFRSACQPALSFTISWSLLKLMSFELVKPSNHLVLSLPFLLLPSVFPSIRVFSNELTLHQLAKLLELQIQHHPSNEDSGLISSRIDWLDLADQGTLNNILQHHSSKASIHWYSAFFMVQLSHLYMTTGKTIALTIWIFVGKVISLLSNMVSRLVIAFLKRNKFLLIPWLQTPTAVILQHKKIKSVTVCAVSPSICHEVMGLDTMILVF